VRLALSLGILSVTNVLLGFLAHWYILTTLGPGVETDALYAAMALPQFILGVFAGSLVYVLMPLLSTADEDCWRQDTWNMLLSAGGAAIVLSLLLGLLASLWAPALFPGFSGAGRMLIVSLVRVQLVGLAFSVPVSILWATHAARGRFIRAETCAIASAVLCLALLVPGLPRFGIVAAAWALALKTVFNVLLLLTGIGSPRFGGRRTRVVRDAWNRLRPLLLGTIYYKTEPLVDRFLASLALPGSLSLFALSRQIYDAGAVVLSRALVSPMVPELSQSAARGDWLRYDSVLRKRLIVMGVLTAAVVLAVALFGEFALSLVFRGGRFSADSIRVMWHMMLLLGVAFVFGMLNDIQAFAFYAVGDTTTPTRAISLVYTFSVVVKVAAFFRFGIMGLAAAAGFQTLLLSVILAVKLRRTARAKRAYGRMAGEAISEPIGGDVLDLGRKGPVPDLRGVGNIKAAD
jgi:putative peptidoglycan lipid II flippase